MKITVAGTGYVGLVTGTCLANLGNDVTCLDIDQNIVKTLSGGQLTIYEPGLEDLFHRNLHKNRLSFSSDIKKVIPGSEIIFICVGTPCNENNEADLGAVSSLAEEIGTPVLLRIQPIRGESAQPRKEIRPLDRELRAGQ